MRASPVLSRLSLTGYDNVPWALTVFNLLYLLITRGVFK